MRRWIAPTLIVMAAVIAGCAGGYDSSPEEAAKPAMSPEQVEAAVTELLAKADRADESEDQVVEKCTGCGLAMDGSPDHAVMAHGYEIHFCSASCMERASENIDEAILALGELEESSTEATN